jgi:DNA-binding LytR/AlgR family response regulator
MNKLRCIAIDDEPMNLEILIDDLTMIPNVEIVGKYHNPMKAIEPIQQGLVDLMFLDIQMPNLLGTDFLRTLPNPPMVIFTTAYSEYALEGYELSVVDYLMKPIPFVRLLNACNKAFDLHKLKQIQPVQSNESFFFVKSEYKEIKIFYGEILYIEGLKDYVKIYLESQQRPILTRMNMKAIEAKLPKEAFCRVHKCFIVPFGRITAFHKTKLQIGSLEIPVGAVYADDFLVKYRR